MKIPRDKQLHLLAGLLGGVGIVALSVITTLWGLAIAVFLGVVALGGIKERLDKWLHNGTPSWADFAWTVAGGGVVSSLVWMAMRGAT